MAKQYKKNLYNAPALPEDYSSSVEINDPAFMKNETSQPNVETKICRIRAITHDAIFIEFDGCGLLLPRKEKCELIKIGDVIAVKYCGEIGTASFKLM